MDLFAILGIIFSLSRFFKMYVKSFCGAKLFVKDLRFEGFFFRFLPIFVLVCVCVEYIDRLKLFSSLYGQPFRI